MPDEAHGNEDTRLIEDYLPIEAISKAASSEKSTRKGHISTLHLWWARRPLVACRAAVYGVLVSASQFMPENGPDDKKQSLGRANAAKFIKRLCRYASDSKLEVKAEIEQAVQEAQRHILQAHAQRLSVELTEAKTTGKWPAWVDEFKWPKDKSEVKREDIESGHAPRPRVLDMFAGGGAIPLEALRLGCEAYALDINPVAHIIELCTLVYPQKYGKPDPNVIGMTGPKNEKDETTWGGLAEEVRYWGNWVLEKVKAEIGDLYPLIPDPEATEEEINPDSQHVMDFAKDKQGKLKVKKGYLIPAIYLWTRTVKCKNPACKATVPLVRQTWLCKKKDRYVALKLVPNVKAKCIRFEMIEAKTEEDLGFNPGAGSKGGNATCPFCGTVADSDYVKTEGCVGRIGLQMMATICSRYNSKGKVYISADSKQSYTPDPHIVMQRLKTLCSNTGLKIPDEPLPRRTNNPDDNRGTLGIGIQPYGFRHFGELFTPRQLLYLMSLVSATYSVEDKLSTNNITNDMRIVILTYMGVLVDRLVGFGNSFSGWNYHEQAVANVFGRQAISMVWDFAEVGIAAEMSGGLVGGLARIVDAIEFTQQVGIEASVKRGSALNLEMPNESMDAVVTDPPYYDNVPYADISDFFYVWLKRTIGRFYTDHFASQVTPKKKEAIADPKRHNESKEKARLAYEQMMAQSFKEAHRILKNRGFMTVVYAHKTTLGWATLVDALRAAKFTVTEAWPLDTEYSGRLRKQNSAALASSIFIVTRKRDINAGVGSYDVDVHPELEEIVKERVRTLWNQGITGADLVISCVGAGLRAFTNFARVEYTNGEEVPAERFLAEVETVVLEKILAQLSKEVGGNGGRYSLAGVDPVTRFYVLWRYTYRWTELDAGEAIVFANGTHVELDGQGSLSQGSHALIEKKKSKYKLMDFKDRGEDDKLGLPENGSPAPLIDALHRTLWLMENRPTKLAEFLKESQVNREQMRLVAQALAGPALKGGELADVSPSSELAALGKLTANWRSVVEDAAITPIERKAKRSGQRLFDYNNHETTE